MLAKTLRERVVELARGVSDLARWGVGLARWCFHLAHRGLGFSATGVLEYCFRPFGAETRNSAGVRRVRPERGLSEFSVQDWFPKYCLTPLGPYGGGGLYIILHSNINTQFDVCLPSRVMQALIFAYKRCASLD